MPTLLDNLETPVAEGWSRPATTAPAERLRTTMAACRVQFTWWGAAIDGRASGRGRAAAGADPILDLDSFRDCSEAAGRLERRQFSIVCMQF